MPFPARPGLDFDVNSDGLFFFSSMLYQDNKALGFDEFVERLCKACEERRNKLEEDEARQGATGAKWPRFQSRLNWEDSPRFVDYLAPILRSNFE